ncbi:DUF2061 domain-containing protein [Dongia mobilis]|jgi:uncharacterized membrane protein|uniref:DUF2061 domain-containing protein n=1 Tax=Dongia sp. TaxID=1977262 RepID=UPI0026E97329
MLRDLLKTGSFAALHFTVGFGVAYLISGSLPVALGVALIEPAVNTVVFFFHERAWANYGGANVPADKKAPRVEHHHAFRPLRSVALPG